MRLTGSEGGLRAATRLAALRMLGVLLRPVADAPGSSLADPAFAPAGPVAESGRRPRLLLIRPDHLGDALLAMPTGLALRRAIPTARIDWLVGPWAAEVVERAPHADAILTCRFPGFTRAPKRSLWEPYVELARQARRLRPRRYDAALVLRPDHWWGAMLAAAAGIPARLGYAVPECQPFLTHLRPAATSAHAVEQGLALARAVVDLLAPGAAIVDAAPTVTIRPDERAWADRALAEHGLGVGGPLVALHAGSGSAVKNWLPERWRQVAATLREDPGVSLVLTGGPAEAPGLAEIARGLEPAPPVLAGRTSLGQLAALYERCSLVLGGDSGPLHLAAAVGTPTLRLYGPTDPRLFGPWGDLDRHTVVQAGLACQPCGNLVAPPCGARSTPACLRVVSAEQVLGVAVERLGRTRSPLRGRGGAALHPC